MVKCHAGCDFAAIMDALRGLGLIEGGGAQAVPDLGVQYARAREAEEAAEAAKRAAQAERLWQEAQPIAGTAAEAYLRGRGITGALPPSLRFHPACWHQSAKRFPAMVARLEGARGFAVHRTYLRADGSGKADVTPAKAMLGATAGGAVRLSQGEGALAVAEGVETALSLSCGLLSAPATVWAALSTSGLLSLRLPTIPSRLTIASDGDKAGREAAHALAERAAALGWAVSMLPAPNGADWNDVLMGKAVLT
ncbi:TOPRIM domain containing protein [Paracoccaceae bacterium]